MTSDWAVDSCVAFKWVQREADSAQADRLLQDVPAAGKELFILDLALVEVANGIWKRFVRKILTAPEVPAAFALLRQSPVQVRPADPLLEKALDLATRYHVAVYDALFVALTVDLGIPGVTSDVPLYNAVHADYPQIHLLRNWPPPAPQPAPPAATPP